MVGTHRGILSPTRLSGAKVRVGLVALGLAATLQPQLARADGDRRPAEPLLAQPGPPMASAAAPIERMIYLLDGTVLRVQVIEDDDEETYILIKSPQGPLIRLARAQIRSMQAVPLPAPLAATEPPPSVLPGGLQLTLSADSPQVVVRRIVDTHTTLNWWTMTLSTQVDSELVCPSQCLRWLNVRERQSRFVVTGVPGAEFSLPAEGSAATVRIRAGNALGRAGGFVLMIAGGLVASGGLSLLANGDQETGRRYGLGLPLLLGGLVAVAGSIPIVLRYRTAVHVESTAVRE